MRQSVPGFIPWEQGGGGGFRPGDRVHVARLARGREYEDDGTVVDSYSRASDMWSPYTPAVRVRLDRLRDRYDSPQEVEYFIGYDEVRRLDDSAKPGT